MMLSDKTIRSMIKQGLLVSNAIEENQVWPASLDVRLGDTFSIV